VFGVGTFKDDVGFAVECFSGTSCTQEVSIEVAHIVFEIVGVCRDCLWLCVRIRKRLIALSAE